MISIEAILHPRKEKDPLAPSPQLIDVKQADFRGPGNFVRTDWIMKIDEWEVEYLSKFLKPFMRHNHQGYFVLTLGV